MNFHTESIVAKIIDQVITLSLCPSPKVKVYSKTINIYIYILQKML